MLKTAIIGSTGYTGLELVRLLLQHKKAELKVVTSTSRTGTPITEVFPSLKGKSDLIFKEFDAKAIAKEADVAFTALPHGASMETVEKLLAEGLRVIDLSADFRLKDLDLYQSWYGVHQSPCLLEKAVYGLPELNGLSVKKATLVANPGCYPTSAILPLYPLLKSGVIGKEGVVVNSASGVSGAGVVPTPGNVFCGVNEDYKAYKIGTHRHTPEIESILAGAAGGDIKIVFTPHLLPVNRGILTTITAVLSRELSTNDVLSALSDFYADAPFVRILKEGSFPAITDVRGSNFCDIAARVDKRTGRVVLVSAIDNLVKGASGQAVQNMNIMFGFPEEEGLGQLPLSL